MSSRLRHLQPAFADLLPEMTVPPDAVLHDLQIANLSRAIADGRLDGMAQLGVLIGEALTGEAP